ncbi:molybdopterin-guanine dinucleotide biosynthesis protein MobA [Methylococcaceae bacterium]|nr:molybdopterin-guanine dinucleotide biosynthesis protein MobA [Methylococcaceae bacterium]
MNPRVAAVEVIDFHRLLVIFKNEEQRVFDVVPYLDLPVFQHLRDTPDFYNVRVEHGTVTWANEIDLCPDTIYLKSVPLDISTH